MKKIKSPYIDSDIVWMVEWWYNDKWITLANLFPTRSSAREYKRFWSKLSHSKTRVCKFVRIMNE